MNFHPVANIFPLMEGAEFDALVTDIAEHGQREAIWLHPDGSILDGRNRYRACAELGLAPEYRQWEGEPGTELDFVVSLNLYRRHLDRGQRDEIMRRMKANGAGYQAIADAVGVSVGTAYNATKDVELFKIEKLPGKDGKQYPASYAPRQEAATVNGVNGNGAPHVSYNSGNNEWYTPPEYIEAARQVMGKIDLDPASSAIANAKIGAACFYSVDDSGLDQDWAGRVWMNPPYAADLIGKFTARLAAYYDAEAVTEAIVLVNNATETAWFRMLADKAAAICFPSGRVRFWSPDGTPGAPLQGQAILYLGKNPGGFAGSFSQFGLVLCPYSSNS